MLERELPQQLWTIDKPGQTCVKSKGLDIGIATIKTPKLKCRIIGAVTRGKLRLEGAGRDIRIAVDIGIGSGKARVWTCDLTHRYIEINADYRS